LRRDLRQRCSPPKRRRPNLRVLIVDSYYKQFVTDFYARDPDLRTRSYDAQWRALMDECFGTADFYSSNLSALGHPAAEIAYTCQPLQRRWAKERGVSINALALKIPASLPILRRFRFREKQLEKVLLAQVAEFRPDVIHFQNPVGANPELLRRLRSEARLLTAQVASYVPDFAALAGFDLILSSFPHFVKRFEDAGIRSAFLGLGFESSILPRLTKGTVHDIVFVGGLSSRHPGRTAWLEEIAQRVPVEWWGYGKEDLPPGSPLHGIHQGHAWGLDMYRIFFNSRIVLNFNEPVQARDGSEDYANNMRLYEATGAGAMLVTDAKPNLGSLFTVGTEVIAYRNADECAERVRHFLAHESEREAVARAGQARTLREHTYRARMQQFVEIVRPLLRRSFSARQ
jgi:spore maturation protein CgeB